MNLYLSVEPSEIPCDDPEFTKWGKSDSEYLTVYNLEVAPLDALIPYILARRTLRSGPRFSADEKPNHADIVGYLLIDRDRRDILNLADDYSYQTNPCVSYVRPGVAIRCARRPTHFIEEAGENYIVSKRFARMLQIDSDSYSHDVLSPVGQRTEWVGLDFLWTTNVVDAACRTDGTCTRCGNPTNRWIGVLFESANDGLSRDVSRCSLGVGHFGMLHHIVVSYDRFVQLHDVVRRALVTIPIFSRTSSVARIALKVQRLVEAVLNHKSR